MRRGQGRCSVGYSFQWFPSWFRLTVTLVMSLLSIGLGIGGQPERVRIAEIGVLRGHAGDDFLARAARGDSLVEVVNVLAGVVEKPRSVVIRCVRVGTAHRARQGPRSVLGAPGGTACSYCCWNSSRRRRPRRSGGSRNMTWPP